MIPKLLKSIFSGDERSAKINKHIFGSFFFKGLSIVSSLVLIPLTIDYLNPAKYGIWLTLMSIVSWFNFFDIGLGNGLRNKLAEAKAQGNDQLAQIYISTTYAIMTIISSALLFIFFIVNHFLNWEVILNLKDFSATDIIEVEQLVYVVFIVFCLQFILKLINVIFLADQKPAYSNALNSFGNLLSLGAIFILTKTTKESILLVGAVFSIINLVVPIVASFVYFKGSYHNYAPKLSLVDFTYTKDLLNIGLKFFIAQIAAIVVFTTDNMIIVQICGPEDVTTYNIVYKYFSIITIGFTIITAPYWSAFTEAYVKKDIDWIKRSVRKVTKLWGLTMVALLLMLVFSNQVYLLWIGEDLNIPFNLSLIVALWVGLSTGIMIHANFLSGINKITLSIYQSVFVIVINIPLSIYLGKNLGMGSTGVILATLLCLLPRVVFQPVQYLKLINNTAKGIWNK